MHPCKAASDMSEIRFLRIVAPAVAFPVLWLRQNLDAVLFLSHYSRSTPFSRLLFFLCSTGNSVTPGQFWCFLIIRTSD